MPPYRRDMPAWSAASENVGNARVTSCAGVTRGSMSDEPAANVAENPNWSLPVNRCSTSAAAALNVLCPDTNSGKGGVTTLADWYGNQSRPSIVRVPLPEPPQALICCPLYR